MSKPKIHRIVDGERIDGVSRPAFLRNGDHHYLVQLGIYADGLIDCWGLVTLEEFAADVRRGRVVTRFEDGMRAAVFETVEWEFGRVLSHPLTPESLIAEVRDDIDELNGRPDAVQRAWHAVDAFRVEPTEERRAALRAAYEQIPEHERHAALADHSVGDGPLYDLAMGIGEQVTPDQYRESLDYFEEEWGDARECPARFGRPEPEPEEHPTVVLAPWPPATGAPEPPGLAVLRNEWPAPIRVGDATYASVSEAYAAIDPPAEARTAVMAALLRAKYRQHPELAAVLTGTGTARIHWRPLWSDAFEDFWGCERDGRNWTGRLLELVRSELRLEGLGLPL
ncbi:NADAR family protein [Streptomyces sp. HUAS MG47]|uniref:NADAR family protein n=1 Tax=Streptomyces solicamelliae TaxID=3231716 RepID=UPI003877FE87